MDVTAKMVNVSKHFIEERETDQDILEDMLHEYNLPDVTNILMREGKTTMITFEINIAKIRVEAYSLYEFIQVIGEVMATGSTLCLENEYFCQNLGGNYLAYFDMSEELQNDIPEIVERREAERRANILNARDNRSDDELAMAIIPPIIGETIPFTKEQDEALASVDNTPSDVNTAATPPVVADGIPFTSEQDAALAQAPAVTPEQVENVNRRRGRPPRN